MSTKYFRGDAQPVPQVDSLTVGGTIEATDVFTVTINGKTVSVVAGSTVVATVATAIYNALRASTIPEFMEITWTNPSSGVIHGTGPSDGKPFTVTATTTETGGGAADSQTFARASVTTPSGPNWWSVAANWSDGSVPASSDEVDLTNCDVDILYGLDQNAVTLARLTRWPSFTGKVGLADVYQQAGAAGSAGYREYRQKQLKIGISLLVIYPSNAGRFRVDLQAVESAMQIVGTGDSDDRNLAAVEIKGTHADNTCQVIAGTVDVAMGSGETATLKKLFVGYETTQESDATVRCGPGCTLTEIEKSGGILHTYGPVAAGKQYGGDWHHYDGTFDAPEFSGGNLFYRSADKLDSPVFSGDAVLDLRRDLRPREIEDAAFHNNASVHDPYATVTWTNGIDLVNRGTEGEIDIGRNVNLAITAL